MGEFGYGPDSVTALSILADCTRSRMGTAKIVQVQTAVTALLPAISTGLKQSTATPEGLGNLFGVMGQQRDLYAMYDDPQAAFGQEGRSAGNDVLSVIFGSPDVSRAVADQAQNFSGVDSSVLKKMLPVLAGILISGLMRGGSGQAAPSAPPTSPAQGGGLGEILGQMIPGSSGAPPSPGHPIPAPGGQPFPVPTEAGGPPNPGGDLLGHILREFEKGIREARIKPVIVGGGPMQIPIPDGQAGPAPTSPNQPQMPGGDVLGQILRDILGGAMGGGAPTQRPQGRQGQSSQMKDLSDLSKQLGVMGGAGATVFGDQFEAGRDVEQRHLDNIQGIFDRFYGAQRR
jgi:hypothetical protein